MIDTRCAACLNNRGRPFAAETTIEGTALCLNHATRVLERLRQSGIYTVAEAVYLTLEGEKEN